MKLEKQNLDLVLMKKNNIFLQKYNLKKIIVYKIFLKYFYGANFIIGKE